MDDGFHHRDDEAMRGVRAIRVPAGSDVGLLVIAVPGGDR
jgi:hypothetical protein